MKTSLLIMLSLFSVGAGQCHAQVSGNLAYSANGAKGRAEQREQNKRLIPEQERPPTNTSMFVDADVLMNVKADEFVAVFGLSQEGETVAECNLKMAAVVEEFTGALLAMKIAEEDLDLDFVTQTKIYGFEVAGDLAKEKLVGFELKKNLSIHYRDRSLIDQLVVTAARFQIYDLIKVDYIVKDVNLMQDKLMSAATKVIEQKAARYNKLLGIKLVPPAQVFAEIPAVYYPTEMYDSYTAVETEQIDGPPDRQRFTVQRARKGTTFVFNGLSGDGFDQVINPVVIEPVVQFTLYLKVKYEVEQIKAK
jgi:uncharacterized protein YggE